MEIPVKEGLVQIRHVGRCSSPFLLASIVLSVVLG
jgi:hypothetical protein